MKKISKKIARSYGVSTKGVNSLYDYFMLDNGNIIDSVGDLRYLQNK